MNEFENIVETCLNTSYCQKCKYYNHDTGACVFDESPTYWDLTKINALITPDTKSKKRGVK